MRKHGILMIIAAVLFGLMLTVGCTAVEVEEPVSLPAEPTEEEYLIKTFTYDGEEREFILYLPEVYSKESSLPLVVFLHSWGWDARREMWNSDFNEVAEEYGFVIVYPNATPNWNSCDLDDPVFPTPDTDDVAYIKALITEIHDRYNINLDQVYATGYSNGGKMAYRLACEASEQISAIASVAGSMCESIFESCSPRRVISVMEIHGTGDTTYPYSGKSGGKSVEEGIEFWATTNECGSMVTEAMPDIDPDDGSTIEKTTHSECAEGSSVVLMKVENAGHTWPGEDDSTFGRVNKDIDASIEIWKFFADH
jgi:polyhydroxybutyrate depolymerase